MNCKYERFPDRHAADLALTERRARAERAGTSSSFDHVSYDCRACGGAHVRRVPLQVAA